MAGYLWATLAFHPNNRPIATGNPAINTGNAVIKHRC
jgi:hypothetical protein